VLAKARAVSKDVLAVAQPGNFLFEKAMQALLALDQRQ
jgi:hypothetical protein